MAFNPKQIRTYVWKFLVGSLVNISRSVYEHPFYVGLFFFVIFLNRLLPFLFTFLVSSLPIFLCSGLLLGILLSYGQQNTPRKEHRTVHWSPSTLKKKNKTAEKNQESSTHKRRRKVINLGSVSDAEKSIKRSGDLIHQDVEISGSLSAHSSEHDSDSAESSSQEASETDTTPRVDELNPLLDSEIVDKAKSNSASELDEGSGDEKAENEEESGDEEAKEEKEGDGAEQAVKWTEDDEKNVMVLGTSELERNQRLEKLIAKRRAWRNKIEAERNLIDLDSDGLSHFQAQIPPIVIQRQNPFDLPYDSEENLGFYEVPGSAPSVLLPRMNPFDSPPHHFDSPSQQPGLFPQKDQLFKRYESFAHVNPPPLDIKFIPYFISERINTDDKGYTNLQRNLNSKSEVSSSEEESEAESSESYQDHDSEQQNPEGACQNKHESLGLHEDKPKEDIDGHSQIISDHSSKLNSNFSSRSLNEDADNVVESLNAEPVYDLSPSATEKSLDQVNILLNSSHPTKENLSDKKVMGKPVKVNRSKSVILSESPKLEVKQVSGAPEYNSKEKHKSLSSMVMNKGTDHNSDTDSDASSSSSD